MFWLINYVADIRSMWMKFHLFVSWLIPAATLLFKYAFN